MSSAVQQAGALPTTSQLLELAELGSEARALHREGAGHRDFVAVLVEGERYSDAVRFLAFALPRREAIWWAWSCARQVSGESAAPEVAAALDATQRWITEPTDEFRRAAFEAAEGAGFGTPAGCAALAAFLSWGSLAPPGMEEVPVGPYEASKAIAGSIILAAVAREPEEAPARFQEFIVKGLDLATRLRLWLPGPR